MRKLLLFVFIAVPAMVFAQSFPQSVCEKLTYPQIVHRPRCFESKQCKIYPHLRRCEDIYGNEGHGTKIPACCWEGPQPNEGGRGGKSIAKGGEVGAAPSPHRCDEHPVYHNGELTICETTQDKTIKCCWKNLPQQPTKGGEEAVEEDNSSSIISTVKVASPKAPVKANKVEKAPKAKITSAKEPKAEEKAPVKVNKVEKPEVKKPAEKALAVKNNKGPVKAPVAPAKKTSAERR